MKNLDVLGYRSVMIGLNQVPPVASVGRGLASYLITEDSATLYYSLQVLDVSSPITAAHIHLGHAGQNGEVVANLCGAGTAPACASQGTIATGTIAASSLVGSLAGHPLADLVLAMATGGTYTNVHTSNFPDGEIRGQIRLVASGGEVELESDQSCASTAAASCAAVEPRPIIGRAMTGPVEQLPAILIVDPDSQARSVMHTPLARRFGQDYRIVTAESARRSSPDAPGAGK